MGRWALSSAPPLYMKNKKDGQTLEAYLDEEVFVGQKGEEIQPDPEDVKGFDQFMERYAAGLAIERAAVDSLKA